MLHHVLVELVAYDFGRLTVYTFRPDLCSHCLLESVVFQHNLAIRVHALNDVLSHFQQMTVGFHLAKLFVH